MKKQWTFWWIANIIWMILFAVGTGIVWTRTVDGASVTQTFDLKLGIYSITDCIYNTIPYSNCMDDC